MNYCYTNEDVETFPFLAIKMRGLRACSALIYAIIIFPTRFHFFHRRRRRHSLLSANRVRLVPASGSGLFFLFF